MKKWTVLILAILAVLCLAAAAHAEPEPEPEMVLYLRDELMEREPNFLLWAPDYFEIYSDSVRNTNVLFYYDENTEPIWVYINDDGYGQAWFTSGTTDADPYHLDPVYNEQNLVRHYTARLEYQDEDGNVLATSNTFEYSAGMTSAETPVYAPQLTNVNSGAIHQDDAFSVTVSNEAGFQTMCVAVFDANGECVVDSHWVDVNEGAAPTVIDTPLLKLAVNQQYTARVFGLMHGRPMAYAPEVYDILVLSPDSQADGTDILMRGLHDEYLTGDLIMPIVYYPNSEGMENIQMEIAVFASRFENTHNRWDSHLYLWPDETGGIYYQPEVWDNPIYSWNAGEHVFRVKIWLNEDDDQHILLDSFETTFNVTSNGPITEPPVSYDPELPDFIDAASLPYTFTVRRPDADNYRMWGGVYDLLDENYYQGFWYDDSSNEPMEITVTSVTQRVYVCIQAEKHGYNLYEREATIPVVRNSSKISLWTDDTLTEPLPLLTEFPLWVSAPGADWIRLENYYGEMFTEYDPDLINSGDPIAFSDSICVAGPNSVIATAQFTDKKGRISYETAVLVLQGYAEGEAGPFTATIDRDNVGRGETVTVNYTKSENASHYWVDVDVWNEDWNDWEWFHHLADLFVWDENNGGTAVLSTMELEPGEYRLRALAEAEGYYRAETVITDHFTVREAEMPDSGILVAVTSDDVETSENFQLSAYAPGAEWIEVYWDRNNDYWNNEGNDADRMTRDHSYSRSGTYRIAVRAGRNVYDDEGNIIEDHDGEGNTWNRQEYWWSDPVTVTVSAPNGPLTLAVPEGIPATLAPSDDAEISFTAQKPENAESLSASVWIEGGGGSLFWDYTREDELAVHADTPLEAGQSLGVSLHAEARGYESADLDLRIPVLEAASSDLVLLTIGDGEFHLEEGKYQVPMGGHIRFLVGAAPGHELTAVKFFTPDGWWNGGEEVRHDNYEEWFENGKAFFDVDFNNDSHIGMDFPVYAMARIDNSASWVRSEIIWVRQLGYQIGAYHFTSGATMTVERGEDAVFTFSEAEGADHYWVDAWDTYGYDSSYNPVCSCSGRTVTMSTAQLPEGEYTIRGRAGTNGKGWRESDDSVRLIVTASAMPAGEVRLTVDKTEALTGEEISASVFAPGADYVELYRKHTDSGWTDRFAYNDGAGASGSFSEGDVRTVLVYGRAHYYERDGQGNTIPAWDEYGYEYTKELPYVDSDPVEVTIIAPYGPLALDGSEIPVSASAGTALPLYVPVPEHADNMDWELYLNRDFDNPDQYPEYSGKGAINFTVPGREIAAGNTLNLQIWANGKGYSSADINLAIRVLNAPENRITLSVSESELDVHEEFTVTVTVTANNVDSINYNDGTGFWTEWNSEQNQHVNQDLKLDQNGQWSFSRQCYDHPGIYALYAGAWINGTWVASDPVKVTVTQAGTVGDFSVALEQATVTRGDIVRLNYEVPGHSVENRYDLHHERNREADGDNWVQYELNWQRDTAAHQMIIATADMPAGEYRLSIRAQGENGYVSRESRELLLTVNEPVETAIRFEVAGSAVRTSENVQVSLYAPGAAYGEIYWREDDSRGFGGESWSDGYSYGNAGVYRIFARVWYSDQADDFVDTDPVTVTVTSNGQKIPLDFSRLPAAIVVGRNTPIEVPRPEGSDYMDWEICFNDNNDPYADNHNGAAESLYEVMPDWLQAGDTVLVKVWTGAVGYENNHQETRIPVVAAPDERITLTVSENPTLVNKNFTVTVSAPGASYVQYFDGYAFRSTWNGDVQDYVIDSLPLNNEGKWIYEEASFDSAGTHTLYARAWIPDEADENEGVWITSAPVTVTVNANGTVGDIALTPDSAAVTRGDIVALNYTVADHSIERDYVLHYDRERQADGDNWIDFGLRWQLDEDNNQITFSTADMPAGTYWLSVWAPGEEGYEGRETDRIRLTVSEPAENAVAFEVSRSTVLTHEVIQASVYAPGACMGAIFLQENDSRGFDGESWSGRISYSDAGVYQAFARVWYSDQADDFVDSDMITITVTSNGKLPFDFSGVPPKAIAGRDTQITVPRPDGAGYMGWDICINDTEYVYCNDGEYDSLDLVIPGENLQEGDTICLNIWTGGVGYDHNHQDLHIPVIGQAEDNIQFALNSDSVVTSEDISCTVTFPAGAYTKIQFFNGYGYCTEEDLNPADTEWLTTFTFDFIGTYSLYARLQRANDGEWVYTSDTEVEVTAPNGPLTLDVSGVPARIFEGRDVTFSLGDITDSNGDPVDVQPDYVLYYDGGATYLISWEDTPKTGTITISSDDIVAGRVYTLDYEAYVQGYEPAKGTLIIQAYAEPTVTLSVDKKNVTYGEEVTFTVNAPGATSTSVVKWEDDAAGNVVPWGTTWRTGWWGEDHVGTFQFGATATFEGFGTVTTGPVTVNVRSLGDAPAPEYIDMPTRLTEGNGCHIQVYQAPGGKISIWAYYNGEEVGSNEYSHDQPTELELNNVQAGTYRVVIRCSQDGYDDVQIERTIEVGYWFNCRRPVRWEWAEDFSAATAVFGSMNYDYDLERYEAELPVEAEISSEITTAPTCGATGIRTYTATEKYSGFNYQDTRTETLAMAEHDWGEPVFTWTETEGGYTATATFTCLNDDTHTRVENAEVTHVRHTDATCAKPEETVYRAACEGFSEDKTVEGEPAPGHDWAWRIVWNDDYTAYATRTCGRCGTTENQDVDVVRTVTRQATCLLREEVTWSVDVTLDGQHLASSRKQYTSRAPHTPGEPEFSADGHYVTTHCSVCHELISTDFYGHHWSDTVYEWADDCRSVTAKRTCDLSPDLPHHDIETVAATGREAPAATCEAAGQMIYTSAAFRNPDFTVQTKTVPIPALGHDWSEPTYVWSDDNTEVTATRVCAHDPNHEHDETETVKVRVEVRKTPTDAKAGTKAYVAEFENPAFSRQEKTAVIPALSGLTTLRLPSHLEVIESEAFANLACQVIYIPAGCTKIEDDAFANCRNLIYVWIPAGVTDWTMDAFSGCSELLAIDHPAAD